MRDFFHGHWILWQCELIRIPSLIYSSTNLNLQPSPSELLLPTYPGASFPSSSKCSLFQFAQKSSLSQLMSRGRRKSRLDLHINSPVFNLESIWVQISVSPRRLFHSPLVPSSALTNNENRWKTLWVSDASTTGYGCVFVFNVLIFKWITGFLWNDRSLRQHRCRRNWRKINSGLRGGLSLKRGDGRPEY